MIQSYQKVLTIAGSDCGGGAGIQADLKTFSALNVYGMSVITALTAQNTLGVQKILPVPTSFIAHQLDSIFQDMGADVVKIGMLHSAEVMQVVAEKLIQYQVKNIILDTVMIATSGHLLIEEAAISTLKSHLFPLATLITPNLPEASVLLGKPIKSSADMALHLKSLTQWGNKAVLLKGGHLEDGLCEDFLYIPEMYQIQEFVHPKIDTPHTHGTGCSLSAAIAAFWAQGQTLPQATEQAIEYVYQALLAGKEKQLGKGRGPIHHNWRK